MKRISFIIIISLIVLQPLLAGCAGMRSSAGPQPARAVADTHFSDEYIQEHRGEVSVEIPEVFELANIAWAVAWSDQEEDIKTMRECEYYERVLGHFLPYMDHPLIQMLKDAGDFAEYYGFRTNSAAYVFDGDRIRHGGIYATIMQPDLFSANLDLVEDFAQQSGFRQFFYENTSFYADQIREYREKVLIRDMWDWLEARFPNRYDSYKVVFSPLIKASHNTLAFAANGFSETVMYVAGPDLYTSRDLDPQVEEALLARIVFTEIDHNYVNRITDEYKPEVDQAFAEMARWNSLVENKAYYSPYMTFNEYMTWGVFLLYIYDTYPPEIADEAARITIETMEAGRGFDQFGAFHTELLALYRALADGQSIPDLYPPILDWASEINPASVIAPENRQNFGQQNSGGFQGGSPFRCRW